MASSVARVHSVCGCPVLTSALRGTLSCLKEIKMQSLSTESNIVHIILPHSLPFSAKVKNERSYTFTPSICLHGVDREAVLLGK